MRKFLAPAPKLLPPPDRAPPPYFRAPEGARSPPVTHTAAAMTPRAWSVGTLYWTKPGVPTILAYVRCELSPRRRHPDARRRRAPRAEHRRAAGTAARTHRLARMHRCRSVVIMWRCRVGRCFSFGNGACSSCRSAGFSEGSWAQGGQGPRSGQPPCTPPPDRRPGPARAVGLGRRAHRHSLLRDITDIRRMPGCALGHSRSSSSRMRRS